MKRGRDFGRRVEEGLRVKVFGFLVEQDAY